MMKKMFLESLDFNGCFILSTTTPSTVGILSNTKACLIHSCKFPDDGERLGRYINPKEAPGWHIIESLHYKPRSLAEDLANYRTSR